MAVACLPTFVYAHNFIVMVSLFLKLVDWNGSGLLFFSHPFHYDLQRPHCRIQPWPEAEIDNSFGVSNRDSGSFLSFGNLSNTTVSLTSLPIQHQFFFLNFTDGDSDEDVVTDYLTGRVDAMAGLSGLAGNGPLVPIISVTPHSPGSKHYPILGESAN